MIEPKKIKREEFPKSTKMVQGMIPLDPICDDYEIAYYYDVPYVTRKEHQLLLQILCPIGARKKTPCIIFIPGSAFHKQDVRARVPQLSLYAAAGIAVALLEYRGAEEEAFPGMVLDAKAGIRFILEHAKEYNIDTNKLFLMGDSSGGYTALMAGITWGIPELEECNIQGENPIKGIIDFYGPTNIATMNEELSTQDHRTADSPEGCMIGGVPVLEHPELYKPTIIADYIDEDREIPEVLMFHGSNDELVPFGQSCSLYEVLKSKNKKATFYQMVNLHHGDRGFWSTQVRKIVEDFVNR